MSALADLLNEAMASAAQATSATRPARVLLAEADAISLAHIRELLQRMGYEVLVAGNGLDALARLESGDPPSLAVLDWVMPGLNGTEICRRLREKRSGKEIYVVLLADWKQQNQRVEALEAGADDCLFKPVDVRELRIRLNAGSQIILERALRESEERFRGAFEYAGTGMALAKITGEFLQVNRALCDFLGYSPEELAAMGVHAVGHPENRPSSEDLIRQFLARGDRSAEFERKFLTKRGSLAWALITLSTVLDADQHASFLLAQFRDITQRKAVEQALQRSEVLFRAITDNVSDLITLRDLQYKCRYASPSYSQSLGYSLAELLGTDASVIVHPGDLHSVETTVAQVLEKRQARVLTLRCRHKNGTYLHIESNISLLRDASGAPDGFVVVSRIIEDRIQAEQRLQAAHAETELFLQSIPSILIGLDGSGRITRWNATAAAVFGLAAEQVLGRRIDDCGVQWSHPEIDSELVRWLQTETLCRCDNLRFERSGKPRFIGLQVRRIRAQEGGGACLILTGADVTERKLLEEQLRQAQKLEAIGQLAAGIAHEINTPTQYVGDNTTFLKDSWTPVAGLLELGRNLRQQAGIGVVPAEWLQQYDRLAQQADLDYLLKETPGPRPVSRRGAAGGQNRNGDEGILPSRLG